MRTPYCIQLSLVSKVKTWSLRTFMKFSTISRKFITTDGRHLADYSHSKAKELVLGGDWKQHTQNDDHQIPEPQKAGRRIRVMTQA